MQPTRQFNGTIRRAYIPMLEQFCDSEEQVGGLSRAPDLSTVQQTLPHG